MGDATVKTHVSRILAEARPARPSAGRRARLRVRAPAAGQPRRRRAPVDEQVSRPRSTALWPRALLTPFTDSVRLTEADRRAYRGYAAAQRHKGFETVTVDFGGVEATRREEHLTRGSGVVQTPTPGGSTDRSQRCAVHAGGATAIVEDGVVKGG